MANFSITEKDFTPTQKTEIKNAKYVFRVYYSEIGDVYEKIHDGQYLGMQGGKLTKEVHRYPYPPITTNELIRRLQLGIGRVITYKTRNSKVDKMIKAYKRSNE